MNRRDLIALGAGALSFEHSPAQPDAAPPAKPGLRLFDVRDYGATGDAKTLDTRAINAAIDACHTSAQRFAPAPSHRGQLKDCTG